MTTVPPEFEPAKTGITLYSEGTPNGLKISLALDLLGLPYKLCRVDRLRMLQKAPWYIEHFHPAGLVPALVDVNPATGKEIRLFESGAIMQYLADTYDQDAHKISYPCGTKDYYESLAWLSFQLTGVESYQGPATFLTLTTRKAASNPLVKNFTDMTRVKYAVLEEQLKKNGTGFLVGPHMSLPDVAAMGWLVACGVLNISLADEFPALKELHDRILAMPGAVKGLNTPTLLDAFLKYVETPKI